MGYMALDSVSKGLRVGKGFTESVHDYALLTLGELCTNELVELGFEGIDVPVSRGQDAATAPVGAVIESVRALALGADWNHRGFQLGKDSIDCNSSVEGDLRR
jgi:hypothetical protein